MQLNPVLKRLGFSNTDRVAIIHTDDIGMCQASVQAFADLNDFGLISSGAVMTPCPWFLAAAEYAVKNPQADLGVHLTLTSEWEKYRWGPLSTRDVASGLIDPQGYFYQWTAPAKEHGEPGAVQAEIETQVARARAAGMQPTHADTHMGVLGSAKFMLGYLKMAVMERLPMMLFRMEEAAWRAQGLDAQSAAYACRIQAALEDSGVPLLDAIHGMPLSQPEGQVEIAKRLFDDLPVGVTHFILHPSVDTPELRAIAPDWQSRVANYRAFLSPELRDYVRSSGVQVIGYRALQNLMPAPEQVAGLFASLT